MGNKDKQQDEGAWLPSLRSEEGPGEPEGGKAVAIIKATDVPVGVEEKSSRLSRDGLLETAGEFKAIWEAVKAKKACVWDAPGVGDEAGVAPRWMSSELHGSRKVASELMRLTHLD